MYYNKNTVYLNKVRITFIDRFVVKFTLFDGLVIETTLSDQSMERNTFIKWLVVKLTLINKLVVKVTLTHWLQVMITIEFWKWPLYKFMYYYKITLINGLVLRSTFIDGKDYLYQEVGSK